MGEGNLKLLDIEMEKEFEIFKSYFGYYVKTSMFIYAKDDEKKKTLINKLKTNFSDYEFKVLDACTDFNDHKNFPHAGECNEIGFLIIDNINLGDDYVGNCIDELFDRRQLADYKLPDGWHIIAFANSLDFKWCVNIMNRGVSLGIK